MKYWSPLATTEHRDLENQNEFNNFQLKPFSKNLIETMRRPERSKRGKVNKTESKFSEEI